MQARASFYGAQVPAAVIRWFMVALLTAFILGGAGGYGVRALTFSVASGANGPVTTTPFVVEQAPYQSPRPSPVTEPTRDPNGFAVPV